MSPLEIQLSSVPPDQLEEHFRRLKDYLRDTMTPNVPGLDGQTCLRLALVFCNDEGGEERIASLLKRGADPNVPNPFVNFQTFMMVAKCTEPLAMLIDAGMRLNEVYTADPALMPTGRRGHFTLLDYALDIEDYLNKRSKRFVEQLEKHAGPLSGRRRFVADVIAMLKSHGGVSAPPE